MIYLCNREQKRVYMYMITKTRNGCNESNKSNRYYFEVVEDNLTLKDAQRELLRLFNRYLDPDGCGVPNWGLAVNYRGEKPIGANKTNPDGTRAFYYDVYNFEICEN